MITDKHLIVVLGMHRSGTSAIARSLEVLGVDLGDNLMPAAPKINDKGFWEDLDIYKLNVEMLDSIKSGWDNLLPLSESDVQYLKDQNFNIKAKEILLAKTAKFSVFGFKDPRTAKLIEFWKSVIAECGFAATYVLAIRNPASVCNSLSTRDKFEEEKSYYLWLEHTINASLNIVGERYVIVDFDRLLESPHVEIERMSAALALTVDQERLASFKAEFLDKGLRHSEFSLEDLTHNQKAPLLAKKVYEELFSLVYKNDGHSERSLEKCAASWHYELQKHHPLLTLAQNLYTKIDDQKSTIKALNDKNSAALHDLEVRSKQNTDLNNEINLLEQNMQQRDSQIDALNNEASRLDQQRELLKNITEENDTHIMQLRQKITGLEHANQDFSRKIRQKDEEFRALLNSSSWRIMLPARSAVHFLKQIHRAIQLIFPAIQLAGGFGSALKKAGILLKNEGVSGIKRGFRLAADQRSYRHLPDHQQFDFLQHISRTSTEILSLRILIIAEMSIPQCTKYRVMQKQEMFRTLGIESTIISWTDQLACINALSTHSFVIFYRTPFFPIVQELFKEANRLKVPAAWEVDDLVFDREILANSKSIAKLDQSVISSLLAGADSYRAALLSSQIGIASTDGLANEMSKAGTSKTYVVENALDSETLTIAEGLHARSKKTDGKIRIVYGSGTNTHDVDFNESSAAILETLRTFKHAVLRTIGPLTLPSEFDHFNSQIERHPFCAYHKFLEILSECDISIAPLENTLFNDAKSNIKYLEASILRLPSVCSPKAAFKGAIEHGENGFLCSTQEEWQATLKLLIENEKLRNNVGENAYRSVLDRYQPTAIARNQLSPLVDDLQKRPEKIRVLSVNVFYSPRSFGGATIVAEELNKLINDDPRFEIFVFTTLPLNVAHPYSVRRYEAKGVTIFGIGTPDQIEGKQQFENSLINQAFEDVMSIVNPDVVHIHCIQNIGVSIADICKKRNTKYVVTLHDAWWLCGRQFMINNEGKYCNQRKIDLKICDQCVDQKASNNYRQQKLKSVLDDAELLLVPSNFFAELYRENALQRNKIVVNKNGIRQPLSDCRARSGSAVTFGYVGGNTPIKGVHLVKEAFSELKEYDIKLVVVDNTMNLGTRSFSDDFFGPSTNAKIVSAYNQDNIDQFFSTIDVLLFPTQCKESFGLTVREALARNVWVISTDAGGAIEDIDPEVNGHIIPFNDSGEGLKRAMIDAIEKIRRIPEGSPINLPKDKIYWFEDQANELKEIYAQIQGADDRAQTLILATS